VKTSCSVSDASQGIDSGKRIKGRKRHIAAEVLGLLLVVIVTAASVQYSVGDQQVLDQLADTRANVSMAWVDGSYDNTVIRHGAQRSTQVEVVNVLLAKGSTCCLAVGWSRARWLVDATPPARA
jgi:Transposase DDE domain